MKKSIIYSVLLIVFLVSNLFAQEWNKIDGFSNYINTIYQVKSDPAKLYVASNSIETDYSALNITFPIIGNGMLISNDSGKTFSNLQLDQFAIYNIFEVEATAGLILASARKLSNGGIAYSLDNGVNWYGIPMMCPGSRQIMKIVQDMSNPLILYAAALNTNNGVIKTENNFENCTELTNLKFQARDIAVSSFNGYLYVAADNGNIYPFSSGVYRSIDGGANWLKDSSGLEGKRINCVLASKESENLIYCGADSITAAGDVFGAGIYKSEDYGKTWKLVAANNQNVFSIVEHPSVPGYYAAACGKAGVFIKGKNNSQWENHSTGLPTEFPVTTVTIPNWEVVSHSFIVFAGTQGDGLYKSNRIVTNVKSNNLISNDLFIEKIYPQPFSKQVNIIWNNPIAQNISFEIRNSLGNIVFSNANIFASEGQQQFNWLPNSISNGVYFLSIRTNQASISEKLIFVGE